MLIGFYGFMLALMLVMHLAPRSALGRILLAQLVERPLARLSRLESHQLIAVVLIGLLLMAGGEGILLVGPELAIAYMIDLSIYLDAVAVTLALAAGARFKGGWQSLRARLSATVSRLRTGPRNRRARRSAVRRTSPPDNDDEPAAARMLAA